MLFRLLIGSTMLFASPVTAFEGTCSNDMTELRDNEVLAGRIDNAEPALRGELRDYVETAIALDRKGQHAACEAVIEAVRALISGDDGNGRTDASMQQANAAVSARSDRDNTTGKTEDEPSVHEETDAVKHIQDRDEQSTENGTLATVEGYATTREFNADADDDAIGRDLAEQTGEGAQPVWESYDYTEGAKRAEPFETVVGRISSEQIVDADVRNLDGQALGVAEGFLTTHEGITDVIVSYGGFIDIGDREVAVPIDKLRYDRVDGVFYTSTDTDWLDEQPDWDKERWFSEPNFWLRDK